jgi:hypothetical protein
VIGKDRHTVERPTRSVHRESYRPQEVMRTSEAWYSIVKSIKADGDVFNVTEANTKESLVLCRACSCTEQARFRRVCRCPQGVACMKRSTQELGRPCQFLIVRVGMKYSFLLEEKKRYVGDPAIWQNPGVDGESPALQRARNGTQTLKTDITRENIRQAYPTIKRRMADDFQGVILTHSTLRR